ncbi:MAG TPA: glycosyltransferase [Gaiellaceae bacterium]
MSLPVQVVEPQAPAPHAAEPRARPRVALVGPDPAAHGGVAGFMHALLQSSLSERFELVPIATHRDGGRTVKLVQALRGLFRLRRLCADGRVDLVHVNSSWSASLVRKSAAVAIARAYGRPIVFQLHGSGFERGLRRPGPRGALARRAVGRIARAADTVVAATPAWAAEAAGILGVDNFRVVPNTADVSRLIGVPHDGAGSQTVLFLGRLERGKGVFELVEAAALLRSAHPRLRLVLAGQGRDAVGLRDLIAARDLTTVVELPGWVEGESKRRLLASATCLALPSHAEGLPLVVLEAMISGVPVVATHVGGIPEAVRDGREALLVAPGDVAALAEAIRRVLDDKRLARRLGRAARARGLAEFAPGPVAAALASVYDDVLADGSACARAGRIAS